MHVLVKYDLPHCLNKTVFGVGVTTWLDDREVYSRLPWDYKNDHDYSMRDYYSLCFNVIQASYKGIIS